MSNLLKISGSVFNQSSAGSAKFSDDVFNTFTFTATGALNTINNAIALLIQTISNTISGTSEIVIPGNIKTISITAKGGASVMTDPGQAYIAPAGLSLYPNGLPVYVAPIAAIGNPSYPNGLPAYKAAVYGDNSWYDPGQAYIAPSGWVEPKVAANPHGRPIYAEHWANSAYLSFPTCTDTTGSPGPSNVVVTEWDDGDGGPDFISWDCPVTTAGYYTNPGQPYIAPSSGGGTYLISAAVGNSSYPSGLPVYQAAVPAVGNPSYPNGLPVYTVEQLYIAPTYSIGETTTVTVENITYVWDGGTQGNNGVTSTKDIIITIELSQTISYKAATGTSISYSYTPASSNLGGGLVLLKNLTTVNNYLAFDTVRGINKSLSTNTTAAQVLQTNSLTSFNDNGFTLGTNTLVSTLNANYEAITFARASRFHDIVEYTGNGIDNQVIEHELGILPGLITLKAQETTGSWITRHESATGEMYLEKTAGQTVAFTEITNISKTNFSVSGLANTAGIKYIVYLFANDISSSGVVRCGNYVAGNQVITNTLTGSGSISIPAGVTSITLTGTGGSSVVIDAGQIYIAPAGNINYPNGLPIYKAAVYGDNSWSDPGQPYIAPTAGTNYIPALYSWVFDPGYAQSLSAVSQATFDGLPKSPAPAPSYLATINSTFSANYYTGTAQSPIYYNSFYKAGSLVSEAVPATAASPGQPYIAPSSGGGTYLISAAVGNPSYPNGLPVYNAGQAYIAPTYSTGPDTTVNLGGTVHTWIGGINNEAAVTSTKTIVLSGVLQNLVYNVGLGGSVVYSYNVVGTSKITLDWEPQFVLIKRLNGTGNWVLMDTSRGLPIDSQASILNLNTTAIETKDKYISLDSDGFTIVSTHNDVGILNSTYAYMAIRMSNKAPVSGSQIYKSITRSGTNADSNITNVSFMPDLVISKSIAGGNTEFTDKVRGTGFVLSSNTTGMDVVSAATSDITSFTTTGIKLGVKSVMNINSSGINNVIHFVKRATKVFDIVGYNKAKIPHNLNVIPELIISKSRTSADSWNVYHKSLGVSYSLLLNSSAAKKLNDFYIDEPTNKYFKINIGAPSTVVLINVTSGGSLYTSKPTVTITGGGGTGATATAVLDSNYNAGQLYIAPSGYVPAREAKAEVSHYEWRNGASSQRTDGTSYMPARVVGSYTIGTGPYARIGIDGRSYLPTAGAYGTEYSESQYDSTTGKWSYWTLYISAVKVIDSAAVTYRAAYYSDPGQAYIAPSGGHVVSVTITNAGSNYATTPTLTFTGGGGSGAAGTVVTALGNFYNYISYLFATLKGISKVFEYVGNDTLQTIDCDFTNGASFIMIKNVDDVGDFFMWDKTRGIIAGNDPHLSFNNLTAEVLDDSIDPEPSGFIVNQNTATNINVLGKTYIGFSIA